MTRNLESNLEIYKRWKDGHKKAALASVKVSTAHPTGLRD